MENGFLEQSAKNYALKKRFMAIVFAAGGFVMFLLGAIMVLFAIQNPASMSYSPLILLIFFFPGTVMFNFSGVLFLRSVMLFERRNDFPQLELIGEDDKAVAANQINAQIEKGNGVHLKHSRRAPKAFEILVLDDYLLILGRKITAIKKSAIKWIFTADAIEIVRGGGEIVPVNGFASGFYYNGYIYYISAKTKEAADENTKILLDSVPNARSGFSKELLSLYKKNPNELAIRLAKGE